MIRIPTEMVDTFLHKKGFPIAATRMVREQIRTRGVTDPRILELMERLPRHLFVESDQHDHAYGDHPLAIGYAQTISQPYIVAYMTELLELKGEERVLELGTGSGYQTSILAELAAEVYTIEKVAPLFQRARQLLGVLGYKNVYFSQGDGSLGWPEQAPYDRIIVTAALPEIPEILKHQLADEGILVAPVGPYQSFQRMFKVKRKKTAFQYMEKLKCRFVPLIGKYGF